MNIQVKFFASLRETLGVEQLSLTLPAQVHTVYALKAHLARQDQVWEQALAGNINAALNHTMLRADAPLSEGAEVAFFPPVTGG